MVIFSALVVEFCLRQQVALFGVIPAEVFHSVLIFVFCNWCLSVGALSWFPLLFLFKGGDFVYNGKC